MNRVVRVIESKGIELELSSALTGQRFRTRFRVWYLARIRQALEHLLHESLPQAAGYRLGTGGRACKDLGPESSSLMVGRWTKCRSSLEWPEE
jgi:hypothetical protein